MYEIKYDLNYQNVVAAASRGELPEFAEQRARACDDREGRESSKHFHSQRSCSVDTDGVTGELIPSRSLLWRGEAPLMIWCREFDIRAIVGVTLISAERHRKHIIEGVSVETEDGIFKLRAAPPLLCFPFHIHILIPPVRLTRSKQTRQKICSELLEREGTHKEELGS